MGFGIQSTKKKIARHVENIQIPKSVESVQSIQSIQPIQPVETANNSSSILIIHSKKPVKNRLTIGVTAGTSVRKNKTVIVSPVETENINSRVAIATPIQISKPKVEYTITKNIITPEKVKIIEQNIEEDIETIEIPVIEKIIVK